MSSVEPAVAYRVVILTSTHYVSGDLLFKNQRLSDYLNDRRESVISLRKAEVARLQDPGKILQAHPAAVIPKTWAMIAFEPPQKSIPQAHRFYGYVKKQEHEVFILMDRLEVRGILHTQADLDLRRVFLDAANSFLPLTKAVVTLFANEKYVIQQDAIMVNANLIRYIAKMEPVGT
ncbi:MAG: hypothetical protein HY868_12395 [Chloroflexi bacterium]|nr:hypothetical protein [Chloroflexota bacterium]